MVQQTEDSDRAWRLDPWRRLPQETEDLRARIAPHLDARQTGAVLAIMAGAERSMGLDAATERLEIDADTGPQPMLVLRTGHGGIIEPDIHLADVGDDDDIAAITTQIGWSIREMTGEIARRRAWARAGTMHPPLETMETTPVTRAFLDHHGCDTEQLLHATWRMPGSYGHRWRAAGRTASFKVNKVPDHITMVEIPDGLPWCSGYNGIYDLTVLWIDLGEGSSYNAQRGRNRRRGEEGGGSIDVNMRLPEAMAIALKHRRLRDTIGHPVLDRFGFWIKAVEPLATTTRLHLGGVDHNERVPLADGPRPHACWAREAELTMRRGIDALCG